MMYGGIDLHSNNSVIAVVDDADRIVAQKRVPNEISKIIGFLRSSRRRTSPGAFVPRPSASMNARRPGPTTSSPPRR